MGKNIETTIGFRAPVGPGRSAYDRGRGPFGAPSIVGGLPKP